MALTLGTLRSEGWAVHEVRPWAPPSPAPGAARGWARFPGGRSLGLRRMSADRLCSVCGMARARWRRRLRARRWTIRTSGQSPSCGRRLRSPPPLPGAAAHPQDSDSDSGPPASQVLKHTRDLERDSARLGLPRTWPRASRGRAGAAAEGGRLDAAARVGLAGPGEEEDVVSPLAQLAERRERELAAGKGA